MRKASSSTYRVIFIIVNWNRKELLSQCLESLQSWLSFSFEVIVIDNASSDGSVELVRAEFPDAILLESSENIGFARANNLGLDYIRKNSLPCDYIVFLNNDVKLKDGSLEKLFLYLEERPDVAAAVPAVLLEDGRDQTGVGGYELTLVKAFNYFLFLSILFPLFFKGFYLHQPYFRKKMRVRTLDWASGVCLAVRSGAFAQIKGFSESFFLYAEDVALGRELSNLGKIIYYPGAQVTHLKRVTEADNRPALWLDSLFRYYSSLGGKGKKCRLFWLKMIFLSGFRLRLVYYSLIGSTKFDNNKKMLQIYCRHIVKSLFTGKEK